MPLHVIVGASGAGVATARLLAERGDQVKIVTRSGAGPEHPAVERIAADATDAKRLSDVAEGAVALYNCANPRYDRWLTDPAIEELLRWLSIVQSMPPRTTTTEVNIAGHTIPADSLVLVSLAGANRDPAFIDNPDELDITRGDPKTAATPSCAD